ncbi:transcriptional regulator, HxlR family [Andreprevotia lacus DSM 23236]|uniref:Transcriptional regulator, HxlR family n=1 Tax=Andreprevotia lacus DSM 23236 TaxID=1121001 RepID=A0A1W1XE70_9NEIS|nr:helix-turn-helix domain-containing protein [Andreprevotia lacus]SMC22170.1 transcriptional regulator, HxlR family [Andreprevotia lacus DSM 23236]
MPLDKEKKISSSTRRSDYQKLEDVVGCKWSVSVLLGIAAGVNRPGALERHIDGISTKVLSERLRKLEAYGLIDKVSYPEVPPRTEYHLTPAGARLVVIIGQIHALDEALAGEAD